MSNANDFVIENGVLVKYTGPGSKYVYRCDVTELRVEIPEGVTAIADSVFKRRYGITHLIMPDSVTSVGGFAFQYCERMRYLKLSKNLKSIGRSAFSECTDLEDVVMPDVLQEIGDHAFYECTSLKTIQLPETIRRIGEACFFSCRSLTQVEIPHGLSELAPLVFRDTGLEQVTIPGTVRQIGEQAFCGCQRLNSAVIEQGVESLGESCFAHCYQLSSIQLPNSVLKVAKNAFGSCSRLKSFFAPGAQVPDLTNADLKTLAMNDFINCPEKYSDDTVRASYHKQLFTQKKKWLPVIFQGDNVKILAIFGDAKKITASNFEEDFYNPATSANATECLAYLLDWKNKNLNGKSAKKKTVSALDKDPYAVGDMKKLWLFEPREDGTLKITCYKGSETAVDVPPRIGKNTVTAIGDMAFSPLRDRRTAAQAKVMREITEITIPETIASIDPTFIAGCIRLEKITVDEGNPVYHANGNCLIHTTSKILVAGCKTSVIPDDGSVTAIGDRAFLQAATLTSLAIPETINRLGLQCFGYTGLTAVQIPTGVTKIPEYCFDHCEALTSIQIPETVTAIDRCAIYACKMLKELNVPASVTSIGDFNFTKAVLHVAAGSCAEQYAQEKNKRYVVE